MTTGEFDAYVRRIDASGLTARGVFRVEEGDGVPCMGRERSDRTMILIGNAGSSFWAAFRQSGEYRDGLPDPLDRWSERVIGELGRCLHARPVLPFKGPPYYPFQRWARRAEGVSPSPLRILIHPEYGLWHAYRGALIVNRRLEGLPQKSDSASPCLSCAEQPCLHTCPVDAFGSDGFNVESCTTHLSGANSCRDQGCLARSACPAGKPFRYVREQHRFHLQAFARAQRRP